MLPDQVVSSLSPDQQSFQKLLEQAREVAGDTQDKRGADAFFESAAQWAADRRLHSERAQALAELARFQMQTRRYEAGLKTAEKVRHFLEATFGDHYPGLASADALVGMMHRRMRYPQPAMEAFRSAVVRYQNMDEIDDHATDFGLTLLEMSHCYREIGKRAQAKTCVKQAIAIVSSSATPDVILQAMLLDEFGGLLYDSHEIAASIPVFRQAVALKEKALGRWSPELVSSLTGLGMSLYSQHELALAESAFLEAAMIAQRSPQRDVSLIASLLQKLVGTLRLQSRLAEAGMLDDGANEHLGGQSRVALYETYRKNMEVGYAAQKAGDHATAASAFRSALTTLENFRHRNLADRVSIQIRRLISAEQQAKQLQAKTIEVEIEEEFQEMFGVRQVSLEQACLDMARLFAVQGKYVAAEAFFFYAERHAKRSADERIMATLAAEHAQVLDYLLQRDDAARYRQLARELGFDEALLAQNLPVLTDRRHMQPVAKERLLSMDGGKNVIEQIEAEHIEH